MELIAVPDAARRTGLSPEFIRQLARQGKVRAQRFGHVWAVAGPKRRSRDDRWKLAERPAARLAECDSSRREGHGRDGRS